MPQLALRWFEEIRRARRGDRRSLDRHGSWYLPEFGAEGDWGVINPDWGTTFLSPEWMLAQLCPRWRVLDFAAGRHMRNQDVYVLQSV